MWRFWILALGSVMTFPLPAFAEERFLCKETHAGGVIFDEASGEWKSAIFAVNYEFIVSPPDADMIDGIFQDHHFWVVRLGKRYPSFLCKEAFSETGLLVCKGALGHFRMNNISLRYERYYPYGYVDSDPANDGPDDTPIVAIGICSPF